ncbi:colibactin polyketide synthase ClbC, partial [Escherichia coli]|nr:colibactin polyketide synthase ClbC [Escherichia coli]
GTGLLPAAAASGMIATQDVLHLLWEMEQKALHLWLPERHEPIPGYVLAWQGNPITDAQRNDRGFWSEALLADTRELGEGVHSINWVRLP